MEENKTLMIDLLDHVPPKFHAPNRTLKPVGVTLHQTGCFYAAGKTASWKRLNAHIGVARDGAVYLVNAFDSFIWHAQGLSGSTVGIEVEGMLPNKMGNVKTIWNYKEGNPITMTEQQRAGLIYALEYCLERIKPLHIYAHRQSKDTRETDPGEEIFKLAQTWGKGEIHKNFVSGSGKEIPEWWLND